MSEATSGSTPRRIARFVGVYVVAAAGAWQAADVAFEALGLPSSAIRIVVIGALAMLPLVAVVAWVSSPASVQRITTGRRRRILWSVGAAGCVAALAATVFAVGGGDGTVEMPAEIALARIRETLFTGSIPEGAALIQSLADRDDVSRDTKLEAWRHLARAAVRAGDSTAARSALAELLDMEPPVVLLLPAVESPELISLYSAARRARINSDPVRIDFDSAIFSLGPIAVTGVELADHEAYQAAVQDMVLTDLSESGFRMVERSADMVRGLVEVESNEPEAFYRAYQDLQAGRVPGKTVETHVITGSLGASGDRMLISLWALDLRTATVVGHGLAEGEISEPYDLLTRSARSLAAELRSGS